MNLTTTEKAEQNEKTELNVKTLLNIEETNKEPFTFKNDDFVNWYLLERPQQRRKKKAK